MGKQPAGLPDHPVFPSLTRNDTAPRGDLASFLSFQGLFDYYTPAVPISVPKSRAPSQTVGSLQLTAPESDRRLLFAALKT